MGLLEDYPRGPAHLLSGPRHEPIGVHIDDDLLDTILSGDPVAETFYERVGSIMASSEDSPKLVLEKEAERCPEYKKHEEKIDMSKPWDHAVSSAKMFGGQPEDYLKIHEKMDCSKGEIGDLRHRALTHHPFFIRECIIPLFGSTIKLPNGTVVSVMNVCEQHLIEDFNDRGSSSGFIPVASDYLSHMTFEPWMNSGEDGHVSPSQTKRTERVRCSEQTEERPMRFD